MFNIKSISAIFISLALFASYPFVFAQFLAVPNPIIVNTVVVLLLFLFLTANKIHYTKLPVSITNIFVIQLFGFLFLGMVHSDKLDFVRCYLLIVTILMITAMYSCKSVSYMLKWINELLAIQCVLGMVAFFLIYMGRLDPLFFFENTDGRTAYFYGLTCTNSVVGNIARVSGYFDEPGALAFWGMFALIFNKLFVGNKRIEYSILIGLLFTLSVAYYIQVVLYVLFFYGTSLRHNKIGLVITASVLILFVYYVNTSGDSMLYDMTIGRFTSDGGNTLSIESKREQLAELAKKVFLRNPVFGVGQTNLRSGEYMGDNPYEILASDGVFGYVVIYFPLLLVALRTRSKEVLYAAIILFAGYMQRPFHTSIMHYLMFYMFIVSSLLDKKENGELVKNNMV